MALCSTPGVQCCGWRGGGGSIKAGRGPNIVAPSFERYYESRAQIYRGEWHLGVAKCGTIEDMGHKMDNQWSHFLPRCKVLDPEAVIDETRLYLKDTRHRIAAVVQDPYMDEMDMEDIPEDDYIDQVLPPVML